MKKEKTISEIRLDVIKGFGEGGLPDDIREGWEYLDEHGDDMPPGGVFLLGRESMVALSLADLHNALAMVLNLDVSCISIEIERDDEGNAAPVANIDPPDDWEVPIDQETADACGDDEDKKAAALGSHIDRVVSYLGEQFKTDLKRRFDSCDVRRVL